LDVKGEAGRSGPDVRSDCRVAFEAAASGGIRIDLRSKVASMYGRHIRQLVPEVLSALGVADARVRIDDTGALPFVIAARLEAAVKRARPDVTRSHSLPRAGATSNDPRRDRMRRSRLYLPGNEPRFMLNAGLHGADAVILDLEDSVAPGEKDAARILVRNALAVVDFGGGERMVRINQGLAGLTDLEFIIPQDVDLVLVPKCESAEAVVAVEEKILAVRRSTRSDGAVFLMPIIESALGALRAYAIASASRMVVGLAIGLEDYTADIGAERTGEGTESAWAKAQVLNAARAAGVQPIDSVFSDVADEVGLRRFALASKAMGFEGMGCIHPRQIRPIHQAYAPTADELERAKRIVLKFEEAEARGTGVVSLGSKMIDPPVVKRAQKTVEMAVETGLLTPDWKEGAAS
jgi:citrate lyase subunit beta/citryl-CoA lyase